MGIPTVGNLSISMKVSIFLACVCLAVSVSLSVAQDKPTGNPLSGLVKAYVIYQEVDHMVKANPGLTSVDCASKCDAAYVLMESHDEQLVADYCKSLCDCIIDQHCPQGTPRP